MQDAKVRFPSDAEENAKQRKEIRYFLRSQREINYELRKLRIINYGINKRSVLCFAEREKMQ